MSNGDERAVNEALKRWAKADEVKPKPGTFQMVVGVGFFMGFAFCVYVAAIASAAAIATVAVVGVLRMTGVI